VRDPIGSISAGPHSVACAEMFEDGHHVIMVEIMSDVKERDLKGQCPPGGLTPPEFAYR